VARDVGKSRRERGGRELGKSRFQGNEIQAMNSASNGVWVLKEMKKNM